MASIAGANFTTATTKLHAISSESTNPNPNPTKFSFTNNPRNRSNTRLSNRTMYVHPIAAAPEKISEKVEESIKNAKETCSDDPVSGECAAAWDEVEELSAAASHARDRIKENDALENYCKDNPETDECRTYES